jgi:hypothetical protein
VYIEKRYSKTTCILCRYASSSIYVKNTTQIRLGVDFVRNLNSHVIFKDTGLHNYMGKSSDVGALNIWTHDLKYIRFLEHYCDSEYSGPAFKAGAGIQGV